MRLSDTSATEAVRLMGKLSEDDLIASIYSTHTAPSTKAETLRAALEKRLADRTIDAMERLDRSARFVGYVGVALAVLEIGLALYKP